MQRPTAPAPVVDLADPTQPLPVERFLLSDKALVGPGDHLEIRVLGLDELSGRFIVAPDGRINLSLIGSVQAAGKSADELDRELTTAYETWYRNMDLSVNVAARETRDVFVLGEVRVPGRFAFRSGERVLHALAMAGGMTEKGRENSVVLLRREADGDHVYRLDFGRVHDHLAPQDIYLQPSDLVFVPKSRFRTATDFAKELLDVLGRGATTSLVVQDLANIRERAISISR
jgi:polysaccharide export outer membrane protein